MIEAINPDARVEAIVGDIVDAEQAARIAGCDFIFLCTDSHASRAVVCQAAYQYLVPVIDMGVSVSTADGAITHVTGRVQLPAPGIGRGAGGDSGGKFGEISAVSVSMKKKK